VFENSIPLRTVFFKKNTNSDILYQIISNGFRHPETGQSFDEEGRDGRENDAGLFVPRNDGGTNSSCEGG
jgi:hypothetical protein